jgi:hypothetical protein
MTQHALPEYHGHSYTLLCAADRPYIYLQMPAGKSLLELFIPASIHTLTGLDDTTKLSSWSVHEEGAGVVFTLIADSSLWRRKTYRIRCLPERLRFETVVEGEGDLTDVHYFGGHYSGQLRWGSGFFWSGTHLACGFNPEPTVEEQFTFAPAEGSLIDLTGVPLPGKAGWFFTPPPYCYAFEGAGGWLGLGVEAQPGHNRYTDFRYHGQRGAFHLSLAFEGHTRVAGRYTLPAIGIDFGSGPYEVLERHVRALRDQGLVPEVAPQTHPDWWHTPIYCGWGSQCYLAAQEGARAPNYARQERYQGFLGALKQRGLAPGVVVLDDKWQQYYGSNEVDQEKWPDLKGFVTAQHAAGRKVLLWLKAWDPEGLPVEECIANTAGMPVAFDPTNPAFERRLRAAVQRMLAPDGYDADGFKLDFTARLPSGPGLKAYGEAWGLELMKRYLEILYSEAKRVKPDALLMTHTPHPYLADVLDMIRLNDINTGASIVPAMRHRARIARIACPGAAIDSDNWPMPNREAWREYVREQPQLGVPSLYYATHIDATGEALTAEDYRLVQEAWRSYASGRSESAPRPGKETACQRN